MVQHEELAKTCHLLPHVKFMVTQMEKLGSPKSLGDII